MDESKYWNAFYASAHPEIAEPSTFARHCLQWMEQDHSVFELGCGNGRDARFFAAQGLKVIACDRSQVAIDKLSANAANASFKHMPRFIVEDMGDIKASHPGDLDFVYSRFTLHAVTEKEATGALTWSQSALRPGGRILIEARSVKGSLYGKGEQVERDAFIHDGHYRRFLRLDELTSELEGKGFVIEDSLESDGIAVFRDDDPVVIRLMATKK